MVTAGVAELKKKLSEYLARVKAGSELVITERGRPIARIVPESSVNGPLDARLTALEREGLVRRPRRKLDRRLLTAELASSKRSVLEALLEERNEGR